MANGIEHRLIIGVGISANRKEVTVLDLRNLRISHRITGGFLLMVLLIGLTGAIGYFYAGIIFNDNDVIVESYTPALDYLIEADRDFQQTLVAERSLLNVEYGSPEYESLVAAYDENLEQTGTRFEDFTKLISGTEEDKIISAFRKDRQSWISESGKVLDMLEKNTAESRAEAVSLSFGSAGASFDTAREHLNTLQELLLEKIEIYSSAADAAYVEAKRMLVILVSITVLAGLGLAYIITSSITRPIGKISEEAKDLARTGDLDKRVTVSGKDEISMMAAALNDMLDKTAKPVKILTGIAEQFATGNLDDSGAVKDEYIRSMLSRQDQVGNLTRSMKKMRDSLASLIEEINSNARNTAASAEELSASAEEVNASMEQVSSTVQEIAKGAQQVSKGSGDAQNASRQTSESASAGSQAAKLVNDKMSAISSSTKEGAMKIKSLGKKSEEIGKIVETIQSISEQTNLLALNAAIEAARAGEAGRGFAVVADEVRKLAEESGRASGQISDLISGIQKEIGSAVDTMDSNSKQVEEGAQAVLEALKSFEMIPQLVDNVSRVMGEMAAVAEENAAGSEEVSSSVEQVTGAMQQVSSAAQKLSGSAEQLKQLVSKFKVENK